MFAMVDVEAGLNCNYNHIYIVPLGRQHGNLAKKNCCLFKMDTSLVSIEENSFENWLNRWNLMELKHVFIDHKIRSQHLLNTSCEEFNKLINDNRIPKQLIPIIIEACNKQNDISFSNITKYEQLILEQIDMELTMLNNIELHFTNQKNNDLRYPSPHKRFVETKIKTECDLIQKMIRTKKKSLLCQLEEIDKYHINNLAKKVYLPIFNYVIEWRTYFEKQLNEYQQIITTKSGHEKQICLVKIQHNLTKMKFVTESEWQTAQKTMNKIIKQNCDKVYCQFIVNNDSKTNFKTNINNIGSIIGYKSSQSIKQIDTISDLDIIDNNNVIHSPSIITINTHQSKNTSNTSNISSSSSSSNNDDNDDNDDINYNDSNYDENEDEEEEKKDEIIITDYGKINNNDIDKNGGIDNYDKNDEELFLRIHPSWSCKHRGNRVAVNSSHCIIRHIGIERTVKNGGIKSKIWSW